MNVSAQAEQAGRRADNSEWMDHAVRVGLVSYGVVHLVLAWLTLQLVFGGGGGSASNQGALQQLAQNGLGRFFLYVAAAGFVALVVWQALEAVCGPPRRGRRQARPQAGDLRRQGRHLRRARASARSRRPSGSSSKGGGTETMTSKVMDLPAGPLLVGLIGARASSWSPGSWPTAAGRRSSAPSWTSRATPARTGRPTSCSARSATSPRASPSPWSALLFLYAAVTHDSSKSGGLDQALHKVLQQPFGAPGAGRHRDRLRGLRPVLLRLGPTPRPLVSADAGFEHRPARRAQLGHRRRRRVLRHLPAVGGGPLARRRRRRPWRPSTRPRPASPGGPS